MRLNPKVIFMVSFVSGIFAFSLAIKTLNQVQEGPQTVLVVTAMRDLAIGDTVRTEDVSLLNSPRGAELRVAYQNVQKVVGKTLRNSVRRGEVVTTFDLVANGDSFLGLIPEGYQATTITTSLPQETLEAMRFGTRVDVLFTDQSGPRLETRTIMKNVLVMKASRLQGLYAPGGRANAANVTLAVKPQAIETLAYVQKKGTVDISIRPPSGSEKVHEEFLSLNELLNVKKGIMSLKQERSEIEIIKGIKKQKVKL